jgi:hypothetical protein
MIDSMNSRDQMNQWWSILLPIQVTTAGWDPLLLVGVEVNQIHFFLHDVHAIMAIIKRIIDTLKVVEVPFRPFRCTSFSWDAGESAAASLVFKNFQEESQQHKHG